MITWGIESGNEAILKKAAKGANPKKAQAGAHLGAEGRHQELGLLHHRASRRDGRDDPTRRSISRRACRSRSRCSTSRRRTPARRSSSRSWRRAGSATGTQWEQVDMDKGTVLEYENLSAEDLLYWQRRAFREWAFRPGPDVHLSQDARAPTRRPSSERCGLAWSTCGGRCNSHGARRVGVKALAENAGRQRRRPANSAKRSAFKPSKLHGKTEDDDSDRGGSCSRARCRILPGSTAYLGLGRVAAAALDRLDCPHCVNSSGRSSVSHSWY